MTDKITSTSSMERFLLDNVGAATIVARCLEVTDRFLQIKKDVQNPGLTVVLSAVERRYLDTDEGLRQESLYWTPLPNDCAVNGWGNPVHPWNPAAAAFNLEGFMRRCPEDTEWYPLADHLALDVMEMLAASPWEGSHYPTVVSCAVAPKMRNWECASKRSLEDVLMLIGRSTVAVREVKAYYRGSLLLDILKSIRQGGERPHGTPEPPLPSHIEGTPYSPAGIPVH